MDIAMLILTILILILTIISLSLIFISWKEQRKRIRVTGHEWWSNNCYRLTARNTNAHKGILFNKAILCLDNNVVFELEVYPYDPKGTVSPWDGFLEIEALDLTSEIFVYPSKGQDKLNSVSGKAGKLTLYNDSKKASYPYKISFR
jgi:hypothetical protein